MEQFCCLICTNKILFYAVGPCDHPVCHFCSLRLRLLYRKHECPLCKADQKEIVIVQAVKGKAVASFAVLKSKASQLACLDPERMIFVDSAKAKSEVERLSSLTCPIPGCFSAEKSAESFFSDHWQLKKHLFDAHAGKLLCDVCLQNKKVFSHEFTTFASKFALEKHMKGSEKGSGHKGHPKCGFCNIFFYSDDELYEHCKKNHEECHLCVQAGIKHHYYECYRQLEQHFRADHWLCREPSCLEKKFVVFGTEAEFKLHGAAEHSAARRGQRSAMQNAQSIEASYFFPEVLSGDDRRSRKAFVNERGGRGERSERGERNERNERGGRNERNERGERNEMNEPGERGERNERIVQTAQASQSAQSSQVASIHAQILGLSPTNGPLLLESFQQFTSTTSTSQAKEFIKRASELLPEVDKFECIMRLLQELETNFLKRQALSTETNAYLLQLKQFPTLSIEQQPQPAEPKKQQLKPKIIRIVSNKPPVPWGEQAKKITARKPPIPQPAPAPAPAHSTSLPPLKAASCTYKLGLGKAFQVEASEDFPSMDSLSQEAGALQESAEQLQEEPEEDSFTLGPSSNSNDCEPSAAGKGKKPKKQLLFHIGR